MAKRIRKRVRKEKRCVILELPSECIYLLQHLLFHPDPSHPDRICFRGLQKTLALVSSCKALLTLRDGCIPLLMQERIAASRCNECGRLWRQREFVRSIVYRCERSGWWRSLNGVQCDRCHRRLCECQLPPNGHTGLWHRPSVVCRDCYNDTL